jgi:2-dehydro-3-deoxyphosphogluconate aldolase / (4S)-4-hydroxy-2-oxoglutarate aldolase
MNRKQISALIQEIGIIPSVRVSSADDARFAAESISQGGIPIVEIAMTVPSAVQVISALIKGAPRMVVGAGGVLDAEMARRCLDAGAQFLTTDALILEVVECAKLQDALVFPGALTPTEVIAAWRAGSDFVKVVPCSAMGGESYIRYLMTAMGDVPLIAAGGVSQQTAAGYMAAGATALGIGEALIPWDAVAHRQSSRIRELARRFLNFVEIAHRENGRKAGHVPVHPAPVLAFKEA